MSQTFETIVADPPWVMQDELKMSDVKRGASSNYPVMSITDIKALPVKNLIDPTGSILALWVPSALLQEGLDVMKAWGFDHKQTYIWVKTKKDSLISLAKLFKKELKSVNPLKAKDIKKIFSESKKLFSINDILTLNLGRIFRQTHEICLIGISDTKIYKKLQNRSQRSVSLAVNLKHSAKPEHLQNSLEKMFLGSKIELFARRVRPNWVCLGNEIDCQDIRDSLAKLLI